MAGRGHSVETTMENKTRRAKVSSRESDQQPSSTIPERVREESEPTAAGRGVRRETDGSIVPFPTLESVKAGPTASSRPSSPNSQTNEEEILPDETGVYPNGYRFPPKHTWTQATAIGLKAFWKFFLTPFGFVVTIYGLNVVAWGGMIFLLLCDASPAMCHPACNAIDSPRRIWIEYDSQILNALFCVTGFGLIPWRFRDLYFLLKFRLRKDYNALRRLGGIHKGWFRLPGSHKLNPVIGPHHEQWHRSPSADGTENVIPLDNDPALPTPKKNWPQAPLTGVRAQDTKIWKLDFVIWCNVWNTFFQAALSGCMWGLNRYNRPSWTTAVLIVGAMCLGAAAGIMIFIEGKKVKKAEGVPVSQEDLAFLKLHGGEKSGIAEDDVERTVSGVSEKRRASRQERPVTPIQE